MIPLDRTRRAARPDGSYRRWARSSCSRYFAWSGERRRPHDSSGRSNSASLTIAFSVLLRAFGVWLLILMLAIANGLLREEVLRPHLEALYAQLLSGVLLIACILLVTFLFASRLAASSARQFTAIGIFWLLLTLAFEFAFGKLVAG